MMLNQLDYTPGDVVFWSDSLDPGITLEQHGYLDEDLLHVTYPDQLKLDAGCYGLTPNRRFIVLVVRGDDPEVWDHPLLRIEAFTIPQLKWALDVSVEYIRYLLRHQS
jgi:hypothetical protein